MILKTICNIATREVQRTSWNLSRLRNLSQFHIQRNLCSYSLCSPQNSTLMTTTRYKHRKSKSLKHKDKGDESDSEDEEESGKVKAIETEDYMKTKTSKIIESNVISLRLDVVAKVGFGIARNKLEELFYDSKIRVNGRKILKKSVQVQVGDEIDMILERSIDNPDFLVINRATLLSVEATTGGFHVKVHRDKSLLVEDYQET